MGYRKKPETIYTPFGVLVHSPYFLESDSEAVCSTELFLVEVSVYDPHCFSCLYSLAFQPLTSHDGCDLPKISESDVSQPGDL